MNTLSALDRVPVGSPCCWAKALITVGWTAVVRAGQRGLRCREGVPTQRPCSFVELLRISGQRQRRAGVALAARALIGIRTGQAGHSERPFHLGVVRLQVVVADRPVGERGALQVADDRVQPEISGVNRGSQPCQCTVPPPTICGTGQNRSTVASRRRIAGSAGVQQRVGPQVVPVDVGQLVAAKGLLVAPGAAFQGDDAKRRARSTPSPRPLRKLRRR